MPSADPDLRVATVASSAISASRPVVTCWRPPFVLGWVKGQAAGRPGMTRWWRIAVRQVGDCHHQQLAGVAANPSAAAVLQVLVSSVRRHSSILLASTILGLVIIFCY